MTYRGIARGKTIELDDPLPYPEGQTVSVVVEPWRLQSPPGSAAAILKVMRESPHVDTDDIDALEQAIEAGKLPVSGAGLFGDAA